MSLIWMLTACAAGTWEGWIWGEDYIESGIPESEFADGCSVTFSTFEVSLVQAELLDEEEAVVASLAPGVFDLVDPGPQALGAEELPGGLYPTARFSISEAEESSLWVVGTLSCGDQSVDLDWAFQTQATYLCATEDLEIRGGESASTELTVHGDHLFYDALEDPGAALRGQAIVDADSDGDGRVTPEEMAAVDLAPLGYSVGQRDQVADLWGFVEALTQNAGHVNGEGHCQVVDD